MLERDPSAAARASAGDSQRARNDLPEVPGERSPRSLSLGRRARRGARTAPPGRGHRHHLALAPTEALASPRARARGTARRALLDRFDRPVQLLRSSTANRDFRHHYTIQGVLALWAFSAVVFQMMTRRGWHADRVRVLWSAADILFVTTEIKLFEQVEHSAWRRSRSSTS